MRQRPAGDAGLLAEAEANAVAFTADGYFRTGDIGVFDAKGFLKIVDRKKDMIIVSGFNVYPNEVEAVAAACPGVAECACVGKPDGKTGETVRLFVAKAAGATLCEQDLIAHCRRELAAYKVPKEVRFLDALPKSNVGKILRKDSRAAIERSHGDPAILYGNGANSSAATGRRMGPSTKTASTLRGLHRRPAMDPRRPERARREPVQKPCAWLPHPVARCSDGDAAM